MKVLIRGITAILAFAVLAWSGSAEAQVTYTVGGTISGLSGSVTLLNNGTNALTVTSNAGFTFTNALASGPYSVTVAIQPSGQSCAVSNGAGSINSSNITDVGVTCVNTYTVGGSITGLNAAGLVLKLNSANLIVASAANSFKFATALTTGSAYSVTVGIQPVGQTCLLANNSGVMGTANINSVSVSCSNTYTVGGTITGLIDPGLVLKLNGGASKIVSSGSTTYKFSTGLPASASFAVTVGTQPNGLTCTLTNGSGTMPAANVTNVNITCSNFKLEAWVDNWFSVYAGNTLVGEDAEPITQIKSFNASTFSFAAHYPFDLNFIIKDYIQLDYLNGDTGLEYINNVGGTQQMGDGGFIMQLTNTVDNKLAAVSGTAMKCLVIHKAPANKTNLAGCINQHNPTTAANSCGLPTILPEPLNWKDTGFNTASWITPSIYTETQVGVKGGYSSITWAPSAKLIWSSDLQVDKTLLCKMTVTAPP